jgi:hypothetical protein
MAVIWFKLVDRHIQHRCNQADEDIIQAENEQAAAPKSLRVTFCSAIVVERDVTKLRCRPCAGQ